jgi:hypothetical protein
MPACHHDQTRRPKVKPDRSMWWFQFSKAHFIRQQLTTSTVAEFGVCSHVTDFALCLGCIFFFTTPSTRRLTSGCVWTQLRNSARMLSGRGSESAASVLSAVRHRPLENSARTSPSAAYLLRAPICHHVAISGVLPPEAPVVAPGPAAPPPIRKPVQRRIPSPTALPSLRPWTAPPSSRSTPSPVVPSSVGHWRHCSMCKTRFTFAAPR